MTCGYWFDCRLAESRDNDVLAGAQFGRSHRRRRAELTPAASLYAWHHWRLAVELAAGPHTIRCRAFDVQGRSQPLDGSIAWNPAGYAWNGVDAVEVMVR